MSSQAPKERVLFIGVVQDGKVVQERALPAASSVTVGTASTCTFVFPADELGRESFELFTYDQGRYSFNFTEAMKGRLTSEGAKLAIEKVVKDEAAVAVDGVYRVPVADVDKGKIRIGSVTILFKFVEPTVVPAPAQAEKLDFRPKLFQDDDDPVFVGMLAIWTALGLVFAVWVTLAEPPVVTLEEIPDRFTRLVLKAPEDVELPELTDENKEAEDALAAARAKAKAKAEKEAEERAKENDQPKSEQPSAEQAQRVAEAKQDLEQNSALFKELQARMIGTTGSNASGTVLLGNTEGDYDDISERLAAAEAAGATLGDGSAIRGSDGVPGGTGDRNIGGVATGKDVVGGGTGLGSAPQIAAPKGDVSAGEVDFGGGDVAPVAKVVRKYQGQLKYCYEKSLKSNPSLAGRVVVAWTVEDGVAIDIFIAENTTGDEAIATCIKGKIKRWEFSGVEDGDARSPFIFTPQE